jgi:hypothetical protein
MKNTIVRFPVWLLLPLLASCVAGSTTPGATPTGALGTRTAAAFTPTSTATITSAPTETFTPTVTPTPGPPPDLELLNVTIDADGNLMGEIRNNTDQPMILPPREPAFEFVFESWENYGELTGYFHYISTADIKPSDDARLKRMNCILYPGESGVIAFPILGNLNDCAGCTIEEQIPNPPTETGFHLVSYQSFFWRWDDLKRYHIYDDYPAEFDSRYHPAAENLSYSINGTAIIINFDVNVFLPESYKGQDFQSWIVLLDKENKILNILYTDPILAYYPNPLISGSYHIAGVGSEHWSSIWNNLANNVQWWKPKGKLTTEMMERVDHIRVLFEVVDENICGATSPNLS